MHDAKVKVIHMLLRKLFRTMRLYRAQFISMILMIFLGVGIFVGFNMEWVSIEKNTMSFFEQTGYADYRVYSERGFTAEDAAHVGAVDGVRRAARYLSVTADLLDDAGEVRIAASGNPVSVAMTVTTDIRVSGFLVTEGKEYNPDDPDGIWLSDKFAALNQIKPGDFITFVYGSKQISGTVAGLIKSGEQLICVRDEKSLMPQYDEFGFAYVTPAHLTAVLGFEYYPMINVLSDMDKGAFTTAVNDALGVTCLVIDKEDTFSYSNAKGEAEEGKTMGSILPTLFLLIGVLTMVTTMHRLTAKEKTQIGTLKALGYKDRRILLHYTSYAFAIGLIGSVLGIGLGYLIAYAIMNPSGMMGTYMDMPRWELCFPWFCYPVLAGILLLLTLIGYLSVREMLHGTPADALRPYTPKKMRSMLIERTSFFHKLPFGTRWNMRDIVRHKARTAMSLFGIVGCTILIVGGLGMRDTMNAFITTYYDDGLNYETRIFLSKEATDVDREALMATYAADAGGTVSAELAEKTVSLEIYDITHDKVRFPGLDNRPLALPDDGVYVCARLAKAHDLRAGSTIVVRPYGSNDEVTLTVRGVIRSVSESIVMSASYATGAGLSYTLDSLYTDTARENVTAPEGVIDGLQTKQMIMESFKTFTGMMDMMIVILVGAALALGIIVLYNLGIMSYTERYREMATLKVVGFRDRKIGRLLAGQNLALSFLGVLLGVPLGAWVLSYLLDALAGEYEMRMVIAPATYVISLVLTVGMSLLVSWMVSRKNRKIDMVEALKGAE